MTSTSIAKVKCEPPRASTGGGCSLSRNKKSSATPAKATSTETLRNFNNQSEIRGVSYNLLVIDDDIGSRITRQYIRRANDATKDLTDYNSHANINNLRGNQAGVSRVYCEVRTRSPKVNRIIGQSSWSQLWQEMPKLDHKIVASIIQRWSNKIHTFQLECFDKEGGGKIGSTIRR